MNTTWGRDDRWFTEIPRRGYQQRFQIRQQLWTGQSAYQQIEILETESFGRALVLDGALQTTEADEFCYHEPLVHVALAAHPEPRRVLIIGGGDGGCLRRVLSHGVERVVQVEIDDQVVAIAKEWLPSVSAGAFDDPRLELIFGDGIEYVRQTSERFDAIIVDRPDPVGPGIGLISEEFFRSASAILDDDGILSVQAGPPMLIPDETNTVRENLERVFPIVAVHLWHVASYPGFIFSYAVASRRLDPRVPRSAAPPGTRYYTPELHAAAFVLPAYLQEPAPWPNWPIREA